MQVFVSPLAFGDERHDPMDKVAKSNKNWKINWLKYCINKKNGVTLR
jgi:hypothetical protein